MMSSTKYTGDSVELSNCPLQVFEIYLKDDSFFPGEIISGKVLTLTDKIMDTKGIYLKFEGRARAKWKTRSSHFCGLHEAEYAEGKKSLFVNVFRYDENKIPEGSSAFPFEFELPSEIPQTIVSLDGLKQFRTFYSIEALIRTEEADYRQRKAFVIRGLLNPNRFPKLCLPICKTSRETIFESCWSSSGKAIVLSFSIKKQGFVPGEKFVAELNAKCLSGSSENDKNLIMAMLSNVEMSLVQEVEVKIGGNRFLQRRILAKNDVMHISSVKCTTTSEKEKSSLERKVSLGIKVPEDALISYDNETVGSSNFLLIKYFIRVAVEQFSFPYKLIRLQIPIKIGTAWIQARKTIPILLLASVPFVLPRPELTSETFQEKDERSDEETNDPDFIPLAKAVTLLPKFIFNSSVTLDLQSDMKESSSSYKEKQSYSLPI